MKLLFDQNISFRILKTLPDVFEGSSHVVKEGLKNSSDLEIWEYARLHDFIIVTQDSDFNDLFLLKGFLPKILWFQTGNVGTYELSLILNNRLIEIVDFTRDEGLGCLEIYRTKALKNK
jgi:predicted nuclease of predicted toxin-antitoxin system